jgi:hypothetical protein
MRTKAQQERRVAAETLDCRLVPDLTNVVERYLCLPPR